MQEEKKMSRVEVLALLEKDLAFYRDAYARTPHADTNSLNLHGGKIWAFQRAIGYLKWPEKYPPEAKAD